MTKEQIGLKTIQEIETECYEYLWSKGYTETRDDETPKGKLINEAIRGAIIANKTSAIDFIKKAYTGESKSMLALAIKPCLCYCEDGLIRRGEIPQRDTDDTLHLGYLKIDIDKYNQITQIENLEIEDILSHMDIFNTISKKNPLLCCYLKEDSPLFMFEYVKK